MKLTEQDWIDARKMMARGGHNMILCLGSKNLDYTARLIEIDNRTEFGKLMAEIYKKYRKWIDERQTENGE